MSRLRKAFTFFSHVALITLLIQTVNGLCVHKFGVNTPALDKQIFGLDLVIALMLGTLGERLFNTYTVSLSRIIFAELLSVGSVVALFTLFFGYSAGAFLISVFLLGLYVLVLVMWRRNADLYERQGAGPLPKGTCLRVPASALRPGDVICTSGMMAKLLRQSVGHTELVIPWEGGIMLFSAWFERGLCLTKPTSICKASDKNHYYVLRRRVPLTPLQCIALEAAAKVMLALNAAFIERTKAKRAKMWYPIRAFLDWKFPVTGYDWVGKYCGRLAGDRWTCTGTYLEAMRRIGVSTIKLGRGMAGLGTGWFDFLNTEELRFDRDLVLVMDSDLEAMGVAHDCDDHGTDTKDDTAA